jgi:hypothetical protein
VLVDNRICLGYLLLIRTASALEKCLLFTLLNGIEKVITLLAELHCDIPLLDLYRFILVEEN